MATKLKAASLSISVNVGLLLSKIVAAILTRSVGLFAESAHSLFDLFSSLLAYFGIRMAEKPSDDTHLYGHDKYESLSSLLQALFIILTALFIIYEATEKLLHPVIVKNSEIGIALMILTIPITLFTSKYLAKIAAQEGGSHALEADSAHFTTDVLGSIAVLIGLFLAWLGWPLGDVLAAYAVAAIMIYISVHLMKEAFYVFMDYTPTNTAMEEMRAILKTYRGITYHKLKARRAGNKIFAEVHIQVNSRYSIKKAHALSMDVKRKIMAANRNVKDITIHVEPKS
ncbi:MAG: cation diffusion facilitator family transporter [archaeon]